MFNFNKNNLTNRFNLKKKRKPHKKTWEGEALKI